MKAFANGILLGFFLAATAQAAAPGKASAVPAPTPPQKQGGRPPAPGAPPSSAQAPAPVTPAVAAPITNTPQHAPDQLDFGTVSEGSSAKRTFSLITNAPGYVTVSIPPGAFRLVEFREMGPSPGGKNLGAQPAVPVVPVVRSRIKYQEGQNGPYQWSMAPNTEIQIDIIFTPKAQSGPGTVASQLPTLNATGPGPHGNWALVIPLRGTLNPVKLTPGSPQPKAFGNNNLPMSEKGGSSPGAAAPGSSQPKAVPGVSNTMPAIVPAAPATKSSANVAELLRGMKFVRVLEQKNPNLSRKGFDAATLAILTQQKRNADLRRNSIIAAKSLTGSSGKVVADRKPGGTGTGDTNITSTMAPIDDPLVCAHSYPRPVVVTTDSIRKGIIFDPDPDLNPYVFEGCNFGDAKGSMYLTGGFKQGKIPLLIDSWSDTKIVARVPPDVTGEVDQNDVQVKLTKADSKYYDVFSGYKFFAVRGEEQWLYKTNAQVSYAEEFQPCGGKLTSLAVCKYESPGYDCPVWPFQTNAPTLGVLRESKDSLSGHKGTDVLTLDSLPPGFVISRINLAAGPYATAPVWSAKINGQIIQIGFAFNSASYGASATYFMDVYVVGPRGVHP